MLGRLLIGEWLTAVFQNQPTGPNFVAKARIQRFLAAALTSPAKQGQTSST